MATNRKGAKRNNDERVKDLLSRAEQGIKEFLAGDKYRLYLSTMSKFHHYSARNTLLILMQRPDTTMVAGYSAWQKKFHRQVRRGEAGLQIIGYSTKTVTVERELKDANGKTIYDTHGNPEVEEIEKKVPVFSPTYVWDVSQTDGEPLPQLTSELTGQVNGYADLMTAITDVAPFPITFEPLDGTKYGYCSHAEGKIVLRAGMSEAQTVKTAIHELAHSVLHAPRPDVEHDRHTSEVQAESIAFVICEHYGIDTSDYSFPYLAAWSSSAELTELQQSMDLIQRTANELIGKLDKRFAELQLSQLFPAQKEPEEYIGRRVDRGGVYEIIGYKDGKFQLQSTSNDAHMELPAKEALTDLIEVEHIATVDNTGVYYMPDGLTRDRLSGITTQHDLYAIVAPTAALSDEWMAEHHIQFYKLGRDIPYEAVADGSRQGMLQLLQAKYPDMELTTTPKEMSLAEYLEQRGLQELLPARQRGQEPSGSPGFQGLIDAVVDASKQQKEYKDLRHAAIEDYKRLVAEGKIIQVGSIPSPNSTDDEPPGKAKGIPEEEVFAIYQLPAKHDCAFLNYDMLTRHHHELLLDDYEFVYAGKLEPDMTLEDIYTKFNLDHPQDYRGRSLSVSDLVVVQRQGAVKAHFVDSFGYKEMPFDQNQLLHRLMADRRRQEATLDTMRYDGEMDLDKERTPRPTERTPMRERFAAAKEKAAQYNAARANGQSPERPEQQREG